MNPRATKPAVLGMLAGCALTLALGAGLQPGDDAATPAPADAPLRAHDGPPDGAPRWAMNADTMRERLVQLRGRTDEAIAALDAGTEPRDVLRSFMDDSPLLQFAMRGPRGPRPDMGAPPPPDAVRRHLADHAPELADRLKHLEETDPDLAKKFLDRLGERFGDSIGEDADDPELATLKAAEFEASLRVFDTVRRLRDPLKDGSISEPDARAKLADVLGAHLDARQAVAQHEIDRLRERLATTEQDVNAFDERRAAEIAQMTDRIINRLRSGDSDETGRGRRGRGPDDHRRGGAGG